MIGQGEQEGENRCEEVACRPPFRFERPKSSGQLVEPPTAFIHQVEWRALGSLCNPPGRGWLVRTVAVLTLLENKLPKSLK